MGMFSWERLKIDAHLAPSLHVYTSLHYQTLFNLPFLQHIERFSTIVIPLEARLV
jgi:hypothetical protein